MKTTSFDHWLDNSGILPKNQTVRNLMEKGGKLSREDSFFTYIRAPFCEAGAVAVSFFAVTPANLAKGSKHFVTAVICLPCSKGETTKGRLTRSGSCFKEVGKGFVFTAVGTFYFFACFVKPSSRLGSFADRVIKKDAEEESSTHPNSPSASSRKGSETSGSEISEKSKPTDETEIEETHKKKTQKKPPVSSLKISKKSDSETNEMSEPKPDVSKSSRNVNAASKSENDQIKASQKKGSLSAPEILKIKKVASQLINSTEPSEQEECSDPDDKADEDVSVPVLVPASQKQKNKKKPASSSSSLTASIIVGVRAAPASCNESMGLFAPRKKQEIKSPGVLNQITTFATGIYADYQHYSKELKYEFVLKETKRVLEDFFKETGVDLSGMISDLKEQLKTSPNNQLLKHTHNALSLLKGSSLSPRERSDQFVKSLRSALNSSEYKNFVSTDEDTIEDAAILIIDTLCYIRFAEVELYSYMKSAVDLGVDDSLKKSAEELTAEDFYAVFSSMNEQINNLCPKLSKPKLARWKQMLQGEKDINFDPVGGMNTPHIRHKLQMTLDDKTSLDVVCVRHGTPTKTGLIGSPEIVPEYRSFLSYAKGKDEQVIQIIQEQKRAQLNAHAAARVQARRELEEEFDNYSAVVIPKDGDFFNRKGSFASINTFEELKTAYLEQMFYEKEEDSDFGLPDELRSDDIFKANVKKSLDKIHEVLFDGVNLIETTEQYQTFQLLMQAHFTLDLIRYKGGSRVILEVICKDDIDRGNVAKTIQELYTLFLMNTLNDSEKLKEILYNTLGPPHLVKKQGVIPGRAKLIEDVLNVLIKKNDDDTARESLQEDLGAEIKSMTVPHSDATQQTLSANGASKSHDSYNKTLTSLVDQTQTVEISGLLKAMNKFDAKSKNKNKTPLQFNTLEGRNWVLKDLEDSPFEACMREEIMAPAQDLLLELFDAPDLKVRLRPSDDPASFIVNNDTFIASKKYELIEKNGFATEVKGEILAGVQIEARGKAKVAYKVLRWEGISALAQDDWSDAEMYASVNSSSKPKNTKPVISNISPEALELFTVFKDLGPSKVELEEVLSRVRVIDDYTFEPLQGEIKTKLGQITLNPSDPSYAKYKLFLSDLLVLATLRIPSLSFLTSEKIINVLNQEQTELVKSLKEVGYFKVDFTFGYEAKLLALASFVLKRDLESLTLSDNDKKEILNDIGQISQIAFLVQSQTKVDAANKSFNEGVKILKRVNTKLDTLRNPGPSTVDNIFSYGKSVFGKFFGS